MNACEQLAQNVVNTTYEDLPTEAVETARKVLLDTLGVSIAGAGEAGGSELVKMFSSVGGAPESVVVGYGDLMLPAHVAALINGTTAHTLDYDDVTMSTGHMGVILVPTALAVADRVGNVTGEQLIEAIVLGHDVACRLGEASIPLSMGPGWLYTPLYGIFGATAVAGKLMGLDADQMANAFGIAYTQAAGNRQPMIDGALSKRMAPGIANQAGIFSAWAAQEGITGATGCFDGKFGLFNVYHRGEYADPDALTAGLGERFTMDTTSFKFYPTCSNTECAIEATLWLMDEYGITADDVDHVVVHVSESSYNACEPLEPKQNPRNEVDAQFSIPWAVALALTQGKVTLDEMTPEMLEDESIRAISHKVTPIIDLERVGKFTTFPALVEITTKDGRVLTHREDAAIGHPEKPMSWDDLALKFDSCASRSKVADQIKGLVKDIESVDDVSELTALLQEPLSN